MTNGSRASQCRANGYITEIACMTLTKFAGGCRPVTRQHLLFEFRKDSIEEDLSQQLSIDQLRSNRRPVTAYIVSRSLVETFLLDGLSDMDGQNITGVYNKGLAALSTQGIRRRSLGTTFKKLET